MRFFLIFFFILFLSVLPACKSEDDNYAGIGKIIADRNKMRHELAGDSGRNKGAAESPGRKADSVSKGSSGKALPKQQLVTNALDEKQIVIVDTSTGTPMAQGVAYVNKKGEIVKIKLAEQGRM